MKTNTTENRQRVTSLSTPLFTYELGRLRSISRLVLGVHMSMCVPTVLVYRGTSLCDTLFSATSPPTRAIFHHHLGHLGADPVGVVRQRLLRQRYLGFGTPLLRSVSRPRMHHLVLSCAKDVMPNSSNLSQICQSSVGVQFSLRQGHFTRRKSCFPP